MYTIKNLSPARRTYGDLTFEPGKSRNVPDAQFEHLGPAAISRINYDASAGAGVLNISWVMDEPGLNIEPVSINPAFATPFGAQLMQAADADEAGTILGGGGGSDYVLPAATASTLGGVTVAAVATSGLTLSSGALSVPTATATQRGTVTVAAVATSGLTLTGAALSVPVATNTQRGTVFVAAAGTSGLSLNTTTGALAINKIASQTDSSASDVATLMANFNALLAALRTAGHMA